MLKLCFSKTHHKHTFCRVVDYFDCGFAVLNTVLAVAVLRTLCWRGFGQTW